MLLLNQEMQACQALVVKTNTNKSLNPFVAMTPQDLSAPLIAPNDDTDDKPKQEFTITPPNNRDLYDGTTRHPHVPIIAFISAFGAGFSMFMIVVL